MILYINIIYKVYALYVYYDICVPLRDFNSKKTTKQKFTRLYANIPLTYSVFPIVSHVF